MTKTHFVSPEHADILRQYLSDKGVVLIMPEVQDKARTLGVNDGEVSEYAFGGEPDIAVELVESNEAYFFQELTPDDDIE